MAKISIVAPVYGVEQFIDQFLDSIRQQTFQDFEAILVDDGSKDNCPAILDRFAEEDSRYRVIHQENGGVSVARNTGLAEVTGEYVYIVDSDDWLEPTALEVLWEEAERTDADIIYGDWISEKKERSERRYSFPHGFATTDRDTIAALQFAVNTNNKVLISRPEFDEIRHLGGAPWRGLFRSSLIQENHLAFDPYVRGMGDDILFTLHLYEYVGKVAYIPRAIYHYRELEASYTHGYKANYLEAVSRIFEKQEEFLRQYQKDQMAWEAYYNRVLIYLMQGMGRYFQNKSNPCSERERYKEFCRILTEEPYRSAVRKVPVRYMGDRKTRIITLMLRYGLKKMYWIIRQRNNM